MSRRRTSGGERSIPMKKDSYSPRMRSSFRSISSIRASIPSRDVSKVADGGLFHRRSLSPRPGGIYIGAHAC